MGLLITAIQQTPFVRLILGSLASNVHCQGYLLEGCLGSQDRVLAVAKKQNNQL